jgi:IS5 family transposase
MIWHTAVERRVPGGMARVLGERAAQGRPLSVLDAFLGRPAVPEGSIYYLIAHAGAAQFDDAAFAGMYAQRGRPSYPPSLMLQLMLLAFHDNVGDKEAEHRCRYDIRWKYALGLRLDEDGPDETTICRFRARLIANDQAGAAFLGTLRWARQHKVLGRYIDELTDATAVWGAGAVQDTFTLIRKARRKLARSLRDHPEHGEWAKQVLDEPDEKPDARWDDPAARKQALNSLVEQGEAALARTEGLSLTPEQAEARELLQTILGQDTEPDPEGGVRIRQGVAKDRVCSVSDPQMRHGHKTSSGRFDGHKAEIGMDRTTELITHVEAKPGNSADGEHLAEKMTETEQALDVKIERMTGDMAYGRPAVRVAMQQRGTGVLAPVPVPHNRGLFTKDDFTIDLQARTATCPAGKQGRPIFHRTGDLAGFRFRSKTCADCPLRARCTTSKQQGREIAVRPDEAAYIALRAEQETEAWKADYRVRPRIEHKISELVHHGLRQARYFGLAKTQLQLLFTAAVVNLKRLSVLCPGGSLPISA